MQGRKLPGGLKSELKSAPGKRSTNLDSDSDSDSDSSDFDSDSSDSDDSNYSEPDTPSIK